MSERSRTIKLFCPSLSKFVAWVILEEEEKLDLGSIARSFGLEPSTLKLNRHFISRGIDLISSSVTWKSLLSFFASKGLSTGTNDSDALIVDGKLCKSGTKRTHMPSDVENGSQQTTIVYNDLANHKMLLVEDGNMPKKRKMNGSNPGMFCSSDAQDGDHQTTNYHDLAINRRPLLEDVHLLKKRKLVQNDSESWKTLSRKCSLKKDQKQSLKTFPNQPAMIPWREQTRLPEMLQMLPQMLQQSLMRLGTLSLFLHQTMNIHLFISCGTCYGECTENVFSCGIYHAVLGLYSKEDECSRLNVKLLISELHVHELQVKLSDLMAERYICRKNHEHFT